ncbi:TPA: hypothetical protein DEP94_03465 [Candidatus Nomurabacteria bacterium]|nr:hypothetical protein [Candidatus Nomurabacteria bacterium]
MQIITKTPDEIILKDSDWIQMIMGVIFVVFGSIFFFMIFNYVSIFFVEKDPMKLLTLLVLIFPAIGLWMFLSASWVTIDINKATGQILITRKSLMSTKSQTDNTSDVARVELRKEWQQRTNATDSSVAGSSISVLMYQLVLVFKDSTEIPLGHQSRGKAGNIYIAPEPLGTSNKEVSIGNQIAQLLGVPFQEVNPSISSLDVAL